MSVAARLFVRVTERIRRSLPAFDRVWSGFWLGGLSRPAMAAIDEALYTLRANYQSPDHNRRGLTDWEQEAIERYFPSRSRLMVLAVGGGREVIALRRMGFEAYGWESHPLLLAAAEVLVAEEGYAGAIRGMPRDEMPAGSDRYDGVILGWGMYMLVHGRARRIALLRAAAARLVAGRHVLLSFFVRSPDETRAPHVFRVARRVRRLLGRDDPELGDDLLPNVVHRFTREEVEEELAAAGFRLCRWEPPGTGPLSSGWAVGELQ